MTTPTTAQVRAWARAQGYAVADRGRLPGAVVAAYAAAHPAEDVTPAPDAAPDVTPAPDGVPFSDEAPVGENAATIADETPPDRSADPFTAPPPGQVTGQVTGQVGPPLPTRTSTDGPSSAALILATVPFLALVGIVLGIIGLRRVRRSGRPGRDLAVSGIVVGAFWLVALGGLIAAVPLFDTGPDRDSSGGVTTAGDLLLEDLEPGDCVARLPDGAIRTLEAVPCSRPHRAEVYAVFDLAEPAGGDYPGDEQVRRLTDGGCDRRATELRLPSDLSAVSFSPDADTWAFGDREVLCLLEADAPLTGPLPRGTTGAPA